jgi:hypothetical protein
MVIVKTAIRVVVTCVAGFVGVVVSGDFIAPAVTSSLPDDWRWPLHFYISLAGGVVASLLACLLLFRTPGIPSSRRVLCVLLSPGMAALGVLLFYVVVDAMKIVHPWECLALPILWALVIPICSLVGFHLPLWMAAKNEKRRKRGGGMEEEQGRILNVNYRL